MGFSSNFISFVKLMEGPIRDGVGSAVAPVARPNIIGTPPPVVRPCDRLRKYVGRKKSVLGGVDVHPRGGWSDAAIAIILDLYEAEWLHCNMGLLAAHYWTRIWIKHTRQMFAELRRADTHIKDKIEKLKAEHWRQKTLPE